MKHLIIIGARGWGREVYVFAQQTEAYKNREYDIKGFLDSDSSVFDELRGAYPPIICAPEDYEIQPDDVFFVAMGDPHWRKHYADIIENKGGHFITIISPSAIINPTAQIGEGCVIADWVTISDNVTIGKHVMIHSQSIIGHDVVVGNYVSVFAQVFMSGHSAVGDMSSLNPKVAVVACKKIGKNVVVGSGSVVMRNVADNLHVYGNPAVKVEF